MQRFLSVLITGIFIFTNSTILPASEVPVSETTPVLKTGHLVQELDRIELPEEIGKVEDFFRGNSSEVTVLIQDAHAIPDAQRNIQKLITYFQSHYGVNLIAVEGAAAPFDAQIFQSFPDKKTLKKTFEAYYENGEMTGSTAAAVLSSAESTYHGVEDWDLYEQGLVYYLTAIQKEEELLSRLSEIEKQLQSEKGTVYSKDLLKVDQALQAFYQNHVHLLPTLETLATMLKPEQSSKLALLLRQNQEQKLDRSQVEVEVKRIARKVEKFLKSRLPSEEAKENLRAFHKNFQAFQTSGMSSQDFALFLKKMTRGTDLSVSVSKSLASLMQDQKKMNEMEGTKLFEEFDRYTALVKESLFRNAKERELDVRDRQLRLITKLVRLELTSREWREIQPVLEREESVLPREDFLAHLEFYRNASERDAAFLQKMETLMKRQKVNQALFIAGGFHAQGLTERLKARGASYLLVMPSIGSIPEETHYRDHMRGEVSWKNYFRVENGKVDLHAAFIRGARDQLLASEKNQAGTGLLAKRWRDQILRDLSSQGKVTEARRYTRFVDELSGRESAPVSSDNFFEKLKRVDRFIEDLEALKKTGNVAPGNVLNLLTSATLAEAVKYGLAPGVFDVSRSGRFEFTPDRSFAPKTTLLSETRKVVSHRSVSLERTKEIMESFQNSLTFRRGFVNEQAPELGQRDIPFYDFEDPGVELEVFTVIVQKVGGPRVSMLPGGSTTVTEFLLSNLEESVEAYDVYIYQEENQGKVVVKILPSEVAVQIASGNWLPAISGVGGSRKEDIRAAAQQLVKKQLEENPWLRNHPNYDSVAIEAAFVNKISSNFGQSETRTSSGELAPADRSGTRSSESRSVQAFITKYENNLSELAEVLKKELEATLDGFIEVYSEDDELTRSMEESEKIKELLEALEKALNALVLSKEEDLIELGEGPIKLDYLRSGSDKVLRIRLNEVVFIRYTLGELGKQKDVYSFIEDVFLADKYEMPNELIEIARDSLEEELAVPQAAETAELVREEASAGTIVSVDESLVAAAKAFLKRNEEDSEKLAQELEAILVDRYQKLKKAFNEATPPVSGQNAIEVLIDTFQTDLNQFIFDENAPNVFDVRRVKSDVEEQPLQLEKGRALIGETQLFQYEIEINGDYEIISSLNGKLILRVLVKLVEGWLREAQVLQRAQAFLDRVETEKASVVQELRVALQAAITGFQAELQTSQATAQLAGRDAELTEGDILSELAGAFNEALNGFVFGEEFSGEEDLLQPVQQDENYSGGGLAVQWNNRRVATYASGQASLWRMNEDGVAEDFLNKIVEDTERVLRTEQPASSKSETRFVAEAVFDSIVNGAGLNARQTAVLYGIKMNQIDQMVQELTRLRKEAVADATLLRQTNADSTLVFGAEQYAAERQVLIDQLQQVRAGLAEKVGRLSGGTAGFVLPQNPDNVQIQNILKTLADMGAEYLPFGGQDRSGFVQEARELGMFPMPNGLAKPSVEASSLGAIDVSARTMDQTAGGVTIASDVTRFVLTNTEQVENPHVRDYAGDLIAAAALLKNWDPEAAKLLQKPLAYFQSVGLLESGFEGQMMVGEGNVVMVSAVAVEKYLEWKATRVARASA